MMTIDPGGAEGGGERGSALLLFRDISRDDDVSNVLFARRRAISTRYTRVTFLPFERSFPF